MTIESVITPVITSTILSGIGANNGFINPTSYPNLAVWLDASDVNGDGTNPANGGLVGTWANKATGFDDFSETSGRRPVYVTADVAVDFDGTLDHLDYTGSASDFNFMHQGEMTCFYVVNFDGDANAETAILATGGSTVAGARHSINDVDASGNPFDLNVHNGTTLTQNWSSPPSSPTGVFQAGETIIISVRGNQAALGANVEATYNGLYYFDKDTLAAGGSTDATVPMSIGKAHTNSQYWKGYIHEIIIYNAVLSVGQITTVHDYLNNKWS